MLTDVQFDDAELRTIARLVQNLMSCAVEAGLDPGVLESIYYKTQEYVD
jgi:hypothetical protein